MKIIKNNSKSNFFERTKFFIILLFNIFLYLFKENDSVFVSLIILSSILLIIFISLNNEKIDPKL